MTTNPSELAALLERLRACRRKCSNGHPASDWVVGVTPAMLDEAADALDTLAADNIRLTQEVERLRAERAWLLENLAIAWNQEDEGLERDMRAALKDQANG